MVTSKRIPKQDKPDAGVYNRRITILAQQLVKNEQGGQDATYIPYYTCWADMDSWRLGKGKNRPWEALQLYPRMQRTVNIRWQATYPIDDTMRVQYVKGSKTHIYQIVGIDNYKEANVEIILYITELQAKGSS